MTLDPNLQAAFVRVGTEFKTVKSLLSGLDSGDLSGLSTIDKTSLLAAVNELKVDIDALIAGGVRYRGVIAAGSDLTGNATGNTYLDAGTDIANGSLFKISGSGLLTVSNGTIAVNDGDNIYLNDDTTDPTIAVAQVDLIDNTESVSSVNGQVGTVVLDSDDIAEGSTNLFFTEARVLATLITGFAPAVGAVAATDSLLTALNKIAGNLDQLVTDIGPTNTDYVAVFEGALT